MKEVNITLNEKDIKDLQTILDNAEAYADTHNLKAVFNAVDRIKAKLEGKSIEKREYKTIKVSKDKAIIIASNHNNIPIEKAKEYTDSELREVLRHLNLKPGF